MARSAIRARPDLDSTRFEEHTPPVCSGHAPPPCLVFPRPRRLGAALLIPATFPPLIERKREKNAIIGPSLFFLPFPSRPRLSFEKAIPPYISLALITTLSSPTLAPVATLSPLLSLSQHRTLMSFSPSPRPVVALNPSPPLQVPSPRTFSTFDFEPTSLGGSSRRSPRLLPRSRDRPQRPPPRTMRPHATDHLTVDASCG